MLSRLLCEAFEHYTHTSGAASKYLHLADGLLYSIVVWQLSSYSIVPFVHLSVGRRPKTSNSSLSKRRIKFSRACHVSVSVIRQYVRRYTIWYDLPYIRKGAMGDVVVVGVSKDLLNF